MMRTARLAGALGSRGRGLRLFGCLIAAVCCFSGVAAYAETAWVQDELTLNLRTGPGTQYRIKGAIKTGESVTVMSRREGWTQVRTGSLGDGWIPEGFLQPEMPARMKLEKTMAETADARGQFQSLTDRVQELETSNQELSTSDETQRATIEALERENFELRAGARWPEWITGAGILCAGMVMGAIIQSMNGRRARPRIRL